MWNVNGADRPSVLQDSKITQLFRLHYHIINNKMSGKIVKALIGGNWKCNGTAASVRAMAEVLNKAGPLSANSEVVIAAPAIHLTTLKSIMRPEISIAAEVNYINLSVILLYS